MGNSQAFAMLLFIFCFFEQTGKIIISIRTRLTTRLENHHGGDRQHDGVYQTALRQLSYHLAGWCGVACEQGAPKMSACMLEYLSTLERARP